jgi:glycosyltransferase involved in cell wall biosynthesis
MKLLILSFYYPPDLCAGSFRCNALVEALAATRPETLEVDVVTTAPNRYATLKVEAPKYEDHGWLKIRRISVPSHESGMLDQSKVFLSFARGALSVIKGQHYDAVFATSSRLMTAALGAKVAKKLNVPLYLDIRDLFIDTLGDVLRDGSLRLLLPALSMVEKYTFVAARRINLVSPGFVDYVQHVAPKAILRTYTNGVDAAFLEHDYRSTEVSDLPTILYAGNIGEGQGLHQIIPKAAQLLKGRAHFKLIGDGGKIDTLNAELAMGTSKVTLLPPVRRNALYYSYRQADMLLIHLNDHVAFHKVLPSKIFEYAATSKPILAGVAGISRDFLRKEVPGSFVFDPCDAHGLEQAFDLARKITLPIDRSAFLKKYARTHIMEAMAHDIIGFLKDE